MSTNIQQVIAAEQDPALRIIAEKIVNRQRISPEDGLLLFEQAGLPFVGALANFVRERLHGNTTYFNRNFHIEPTERVCVRLFFLFLFPPVRTPGRRLGTDHRPNAEHSKRL